MARVAPLHLPPHGLVAAAPKGPQVAGHLRRRACVGSSAPQHARGQQCSTAQHSSSKAARCWPTAQHRATQQRLSYGLTAHRVHLHTQIQIQSKITPEPHCLDSRGGTQGCLPTQGYIGANGRSSLLLKVTFIQLELGLSVVITPQNVHARTGAPAGVALPGTAAPAAAAPCRPPAGASLAAQTPPAWRKRARGSPAPTPR